jgi:putative transcriptional regulator
LCSSGPSPEFVRNRVRELRATSGMSQGELGSVLGVSRQTINSIENGRYLPSLPLALAIARCFRSTVEEIFASEVEAT